MTFGPEMPPDVLDGPLPAWEIAAYTGVPEATLRQWKRRGKLAPTGVDDFGRLMYLIVDVWRAQDATRRNRQAS